MPATSGEESGLGEGSTRRKLSKCVGNTFYPSSKEDLLLLLAPRRGLTWITQALLYFPGILRVPS